jgi:hypothetical protein
MMNGLKKCPYCGHELRFHGNQRDVISKTVGRLETCSNENCRSTFTTEIRPMTLDELADCAELRSQIGLS